MDTFIDRNGLSYVPFTYEDCIIIELVYGSLYWCPLPIHGNDFRIMYTGVLMKDKPKDKQTAMLIASKLMENKRE